MCSADIKEWSLESLPIDDCVTRLTDAILEDTQQIVLTQFLCDRPFHSAIVLSKSLPILGSVALNLHESKPSAVQKDHLRNKRPGWRVEQYVKETECM